MLNTYEKIKKLAIDVYNITESQWDPKSPDCKYSGERTDCKNWGGQDAGSNGPVLTKEQQDKVYQMDVSFTVLMISVSDYLSHFCPNSRM